MNSLNQTKKVTKLECIWDCNCEFLRESQFFVVNLLNESRKFSCTLTLFVAVWRSLVSDLQHMVSYPIRGSAKLFFPLNFSGPVAVHLQMDNLSFSYQPHMKQCVLSIKLYHLDQRARVCMYMNWPQICTNFYLSDLDFSCFYHFSVSLSIFFFGGGGCGDNI